MTDEALMVAYRDGDMSAFELLYGRWRTRLYRYLLRHCADRGLTDELYQDVWLKVVRARRGYEPGARFSTWLFRIAHHRLIDHYRTAGRHALVSYDDDPEDAERFTAVPAPPVAQPEAMLERKRLAERLSRAIDALPAAQREAFVLAEEGGMTIEEVAAVTGVGRETAKSRLRYAIAKLRHALADSGKETS